MRNSRTSLCATSVVALALMIGAAAAEPVTLDVTAWKGNEAEPAGLKDLVASFEAANPEIKVNLSYIGRLDTDTVLPPRLQGNNAPDVMMVDMPLVKVWGDAGLLADLGTDSAFYKAILPSLAPSLTSDGKAYIMPLEVIGMGNFVNMGLMKQAGIDTPPLTIEELKADCGKLADAGIQPMIFSGGFQAPLFVVANGLEATTSTAAALGSGEAMFADDAGFNAALDLVKDLAAARCFDPKAQAGLDPWSTGLAEFKAGHFAMMPQGAWNTADFAKTEGLDFVFAPIPSSKPTGVALDLFGIGWSISAKSAHQEAARKFVDFFAEDANLNVMLKAESAYSPFTGGTPGTAPQTAPYDAARDAGGVIMYPFAVLDWPKPLEKEIWDSLTTFLLNLDGSTSDTLARWDSSVEDSK